MYKKQCPVCGGNFETKRIDKIYCSEACYKKARYYEENPKYEKTCVNCGKGFIPKRSDQIYCNPICQKTYSDRRYKDEIRFGGNRELALKRDGYKCVLCGVKEGITVHHKDGSGQSDNPNNELENLITLCRSTHCMEHGLTQWKTSHSSNVDCLYCGKKFAVEDARKNDGRGKYCSKDCADKGKTGRLKTAYSVNCIICGKPFNTTPHKQSIGKGRFCGKECFNVYQRGRSKPKPITKQIPVKCQQCGADFTTTQVRIDDGRGRFCSKECTYRSFKTNPNIVKGSPIRTRVYLKCLICGADFWVTQSAIDSGRGKYCGRDCYNKARQKQV
jgi:endogenous inhibitor of DNA gyrase (YacG/DUF329 family)